MKQHHTLPKKQPGESWKEYGDRIEQWSRGEDVRSKTDLRDWTGSLPFHLDRNEGD